MIERFFVWLWRIAYCRGFGIQSPWAYAFVRYVINERYPYYAYERFDRHDAALTRARRRLGKLYFRVANFLQPRVVIDIDAADSGCERYFIGGCAKARYTALHDATEADIRSTLAENGGAPVVVRMAAEAASRGKGAGVQSLYEAVRAQIPQHSIVILEEIGRRSPMKALWKDIVRKENGVVTFDLYYCGIIYFDAKRYKNNYIVNF